VRYECLQPHYNLAHRAEFERELRDVCLKYELGVIPYSPLAGGFLTGKYRPDQPAESVRAEGIRRRYFNAPGWRVLEAVEQVAQEAGGTPAAVALAWLLAQPAITAPIIGANSVDQLRQSLAALDLKLSEGQLARLDEASTWE
jgi:aryl-alcohol dehydrogenase-like predicted oxidoreductase